MEKLILAALALCLTACSNAPEKRHSAQELQSYRPAQFAWPAAAASARERMLADEHAQLRRRLALPPGPQRDAELPAALHAAQFFGLELDAARAAVLAELPGLPSKPVGFQYAVLAAAYALAPREAVPLLPRFETPRERAMAAYIVLRADPSQAARLRAEMPAGADDPRLLALADELDRRLALPSAAPPLAELLAAPLRPGLPVVFSLQRPGREVMGLALVRGADGRFVREAGQPLAIPQLARALSGMPGTIMLGNTPRGLFAVRGAGTAENPWIGPTPYLHSKLPIEASVAEFLDDEQATQPWSEAIYRSLLPPSWQSRLMEAWWAGRAGRGEILMHGTTIDPGYYRGRSYWPGTPSAGCLVAGETWATRDGRLQSSDQLRLAQAFSAGGLDRGYLVVAEIEGEGAVALDEVKAAIDAAEERMRK